MRDLMERQAAQNSRQLECFQQMLGASDRAFAAARQSWEDERREMISEQDRKSALFAGAAQETEDWGQWEEDDVRHPRHHEDLPSFPAGKGISSQLSPRTAEAWETFKVKYRDKDRDRDNPFE